MRLITIMLGIVLTFYLLNKFGLWLERKGLLYYRHIKPQGGGVSAVLQELNAYLLPSARHVVEMKQNQVKHQKREADSPSEPLDRNLY
jgi:hypothetical protein